MELRFYEDSMKVSTEKTPDSQVVLTLEAEPSEVEQSLERAYKRLAQRLAIPGFRKGKAPRMVVERFVGQHALLQEAVDLLVPEATDKAIQEQELEPIDRPSVEVDSLEPVRWKATVSVRPVVELGDYQSIRIEPPRVEATEEQVNQALEELRFRVTPWQPVERPVQFEDLVTLDVLGKEGENTATDEKGVQYRPVEGLSNPVPGFAEQLVGTEAGQTKKFTLSFASDHERSDLAGKAFEFEVSVQEVKGKEMPLLDDEFARGADEGYESLAHLKEKLVKDIEAGLEGAANREYQEQALQELVRKATMEYPPVLVERELNHLLEEQEQRLRQNRVSLEDYLRATGQNNQEVIEELRGEARARVVRGLVLSNFVEREGLEVSEEEVQLEVDGAAKSAGELADQVRQLFVGEPARQSVERAVLQRKALERLSLIAKGEIKEEQETREETQ